METEFERVNVITYEVYSNIDRKKKHVYATGSIEDLVTVVRELEKSFNLKREE